MGQQFFDFVVQASESPSFLLLNVCTQDNVVPRVATIETCARLWFVLVTVNSVVYGWLGYCELSVDILREESRGFRTAAAR